MSFSLKCNNIIEDYLLNKNIIYRNRNIIAIIFSILCSEYLVITKNNIINKLVLPYCIYFIVVILIKLFISSILDNNMRKELKEKCMLWANDPSNKTKLLDNNTLFINLDDIILYKKNDITIDDHISHNIGNNNVDNTVDNTKNKNGIINILDNIVKPYLN